jgi:hypothetical protein
MRIELLKKLKGQRVQIEYGHPYRPSPSNFDGYIFDVLGPAGKEIVVFLIQRSTMAPMEVMQPAQPGMVVSQSNMAPAPAERISEYVILFLEPEGILGMQMMSNIQYRFNPQTVRDHGSKFARRESDTLYTERHLNWEQFERMLNTEILKQIKNLDWSEDEPVAAAQTAAQDTPLLENISPVTEVLDPEPVIANQK